MWSEVYDRTLDDIFAVLEDLVVAISAAIVCGTTSNPCPNTQQWQITNRLSLEGGTR